MTHEMKLRQEPFDCIVSGIKTIELRLYDEKRQLINIGDKIRFSLFDSPNQSIETVVVNLHRFNSFKDLFSTRLFEKCEWKELTAEEAVEKMRQYYTETEEINYGVIGIEICISENEHTFEHGKNE